MLLPMTLPRVLSTACALIGSRLDYAKALHIGASVSNITKLQKNGSQTRRESSFINTDGLKHLNLLLLFISCQSSGELISRLPQFPTNFTQPVNLPTWPTPYLNMFLVTDWGQPVCVHCQSLAQKQLRVRSLSGLPLHPSGLWNRLPADIRNYSSLSTFWADSKLTFFGLYLNNLRLFCASYSFVCVV